MLALAAGLSMPVAARQAPPASTDADFIMKAAQAGAMEVDVGKLASEKASDPDVKAFGRRLVVDYFVVNDELLKLATSRNVALTVALKTDPTEPFMKTGQGNATSDLIGLEGAAFDRAFIDRTVQAHQEAVDLFHTEADDGKDSEVAEWAEKKLLTMKELLRRATDLQKKILPRLLTLAQPEGNRRRQ
jgi:putative membrane protein